jgi:branched-chain amino acid transport system substrate-binding protein
MALPGASDPSVVIGVVATLTGPGALAGQDAVDGFNLALKQLGSRFSNQEVRVVLADDKGSPDLARQQVRRLMERERLDVVLTALSAPSLSAIVRPLVDGRLFVLNLEQPPPNLGGADCSQWLFNVGAPADGVHEALGQYLAGEKVRRVVVVGPESDLTNAAVAAFKHTFPGQVLAVVSPKPGATTFAPELAAIAKLKPDAVYSLLTGGMAGAFVRAWGASPLKPEVQLYPVWPAVERQFLSAMGDAAQGYDAAFLLDATLKATNGKTVDSEAVRTALRRADFVSTRGSFKFNTNHTPILSYYLRKVGRDAKGRPTQEVRSVVLKDWRDRLAASCPMRWVEEPPPAPVKKP